MQSLESRREPRLYVLVISRTTKNILLTTFGGNISGFGDNSKEHSFCQDTMDFDSTFSSTISILS